MKVIRIFALVCFILGFIFPAVDSRFSASDLHAANPRGLIGTWQGNWEGSESQFAGLNAELHVESVRNNEVSGTFSWERSIHREAGRIRFRAPLQIDDNSCSFTWQHGETKFHFALIDGKLRGIVSNLSAENYAVESPADESLATERPGTERPPSRRKKRARRIPSGNAHEEKLDLFGPKEGYSSPGKR